MADRTQYLSGAVNLNQIGAGADEPARNNVHAFRKGVGMGGHLTLGPGVYAIDQQIALTDDVTIELLAGATIDASAMSVPCITANGKSNVRIVGDGKIVCSAASAPVLINCTDSSIDVRVVDSSGVGVVLAAFSGRAIIPHRGGGSNLAPDNEINGWRYGIAMGAKVIDIDCELGSDGTLVCMHDDTIDRTTTSSGDLDAQDLAAIRALETDPANYLAAAGWPAGSVSTLDDVCRLWGNRYVLHIQPRSVAAGNAVASCLARHGIRTDMAILNSDVQSYVAACVAAGYASSQNAADATSQGPNMAAYYAAGARYLNCGTGWTTALVDQAHAAGLLAGVYGSQRIVERDDAFAKGIDFLFADEPGYLLGIGTQRRGNQFAGGFWPHGLIPFATSNGGRGRVTADGKWQQTTLDVQPRLCLLGPLGYVTGAWTLDFTLRIDTSRAANASYHLMLCTPTDAARTGVSGSYGTGGLFVVLRRTQQYSVYLIEGPTTITLLGETSAQSALSGTGTGSDSDGDQTANAGSGTPYAFRIAYNPTTGNITLANVTSAHPSGTLSITNSSLVGLAGYMHAGRNNISCTIDGGFQLT